MTIECRGTPVTLLQITAIDVDDRPSGCCRGSIRHAAIGRAKEPVDVAEIVDDLGDGSNSYFALIDGRFVDAAAAQCPTCGASYLTSADALTARVDNELLSLPHITWPARSAAPVDDPTSAAPPTRGNWRARLHPHPRERTHV